MIEELDPIQPMTADQAATLKRLAEAAYEREAFKPNLTRAEADVRIATLTATAPAASLHIGRRGAPGRASGGLTSFVRAVLRFMRGRRA